ncbi:Plasmodium exported protein, unknown function [Plasmodium chabaudi chabaudi]|uniref:Uncharacterized protein n=1 Tax=Plasmodium chabaudi chabaudi TaxID=31271 RepID=A0A4V0K4W5_PLACU|nr:Plasmodium exported protein, unknown function [Plasmodium chabaudi chabaudi]VTZ67585.1 Plasmodium exported protein, unknown function [Plasmodium chabaudi chabaudi]|eukprot:XP_016655257.1 Plasmodium exported protein, unknown function [Plasmodium chabaudi chabaudi]
MIRYIVKILICSIVICSFLNYNKKSFSIYFSKKKKNDGIVLVGNARILANIDNERLLYTPNYTKIRNYNKIIEKNRYNGKNTVQRPAKTLNGGYNSKYIKEEMTKEGVVKYVHMQPDLVKPNMKDGLGMKMHGCEDKKDVLKESKINTTHKYSAPEIDSLKKQSQIALSNRHTKDNMSESYNDYNLTKLNSQHALSEKNNNALKNELIKEIRSYILKNKDELNKYTKLEVLDALKLVLMNNQFNKTPPKEIDIILYYALYEPPRVHRNIPYYHDETLKDRNKLNRTNIRKETTVEHNKLGNNKMQLHTNRRRKNLPHKVMVDRNNLPNKNSVERKNSAQELVGKKKINDNRYGTIRYRIDNKKEWSSNYDLIKKQNIIKIKNELNKVDHPIEKCVKKENKILHEYKHPINTGSKNDEIKEVNKVRDLYGNTKNDSSKKKERGAEIYMEDKNGEQQHPKKKETVIKIYMEDKKGEQQQPKKKETVIEIYMENKKKELDNKIESIKISDTNKKYDLSNKGDFENPNNIKLGMNVSNNIGNDDELLERKKKPLIQLNANDKKDIIRPQSENVKVLDISLINKKKKNNNKNIDENDFIDLFDNDDEESLLTEVQDNNKIDVSLMDEVYDENERLLFEKIIGKKRVKGKYYKVKKYLKIFGLYILPIIGATVSISLMGLQISNIMGADIFSGSLITAGKTTIVEGTQCLANAATDVMQGITNDVLPSIDLTDFSFDDLFNSIMDAIENTTMVGMKTASNALTCVSDNMIPKAISAATTCGISIACSQIFYPLGIAVNIAFLIYTITKIIVKLNDMGKFDKFHKYRKKLINKLKRKINIKEKGKNNQ